MNVKNAKYIFAGNRGAVLEAMFDLKLPITRIFAMKDSFLQKTLDVKGIAYEIPENKADFIKKLDEINFDVLVTNGCPFILPITKLKIRERTFINVHPSLLPQLRGMDPVPGAILHGVDSGATCYAMNDGIDSGDIISQVPIPLTPDLDCALLYHLSFQAEAEAFVKAWQSDFKPVSIQNQAMSSYYSRKPQDLIIDFSQTAEHIRRQILAHNTRRQGAYFIHKTNRFVVRDCELVVNPFALERYKECMENQVVLVYENKVLIKKEKALLKFKDISGASLNIISKGDILMSGTLDGSIQQKIQLNFNAFGHDNA
jgi:methionyl-tRNA formyltransferase